MAKCMAFAAAAIANASVTVHSEHVLCFGYCTLQCMERPRLEHARARAHTARRAAASEVDSVHRPTLLLHDPSYALVGVAHHLHLRRMHKHVSKRCGLQHARRTTHTVAGGSRFHLDALVCSETTVEPSRHLVQLTASQKSLPIAASQKSLPELQSALRVLTINLRRDASGSLYEVGSANRGARTS